MIKMSFGLILYKDTLKTNPSLESPYNCVNKSQSFILRVLT